MSSQLENSIQSTIKEFLQWNGWFVVRNQQSMGSYKGLSDLTAIRDGRVVWIEIKTPKGRLSKWQEQFRDDIERYGGEFIVARSVDDIEHLRKGERKCSGSA